MAILLIIRGLSATNSPGWIFSFKDLGNAKDSLYICHRKTYKRHIKVASLS